MERPLLRRGEGELPSDPQKTRTQRRTPALIDIPRMRATRKVVLHLITGDGTVEIGGVCKGEAAGAYCSIPAPRHSSGIESSGHQRGAVSRWTRTRQRTPMASAHIMVEFYRPVKGGLKCPRYTRTQLANYSQTPFHRYGGGLPVRPIQLSHQ